MGKHNKAKGLSAMATGVLYQVAGAVTLGQDSLTEGQRRRLEQLLLDVLADPDQYTARRISDLEAIAREP